MVSLSNNSRHPGGTFFEEESNSSHFDDDPVLDTMPVLPREPSSNRWMSEEMKKYRSIRTIPAILIAKFLYISLALVAFLLPVFCHDNGCAVSTTSLVEYTHGFMWFLLLLVDCYLTHEHRNSLLHGYFNFHLSTRSLRRAPLFINSGANAVLVLLSKVLDSVCKHTDDCKSLSKIHCLQIFISLEVILALVLLIKYFVRTLHFNKAKDVPDFLRPSSTSGTETTRSEVGYRGSQEAQKSKAMVLMWYETYFWQQKWRECCRDIVDISDKVDEEISHRRQIQQSGH